MAVTIDPVVIRVGGNPPTHFRVRGTVSGCETLHLSSSCTRSLVMVGIPTGGNNTWGPIDLPNDKGCDCSSNVTITAYCGLGAPGQTSAPITVPVCDTCPQLTGSVSGPGNCDANNARSVTLTVNFGPAIPAGATVQISWIPGGNLPPTTSSPPIVSQTFNYPAGTYNPIAVVAITLASGQVCSMTTINFGPVTVSGCLPCPENIEVKRTKPLPPLPCAPTTAILEFEASVVPPSGLTAYPSPSSYDWTIKLPAQAGQPAKEAKYNNGPAKVDTAIGWTGAGVTPLGAVDLTGTGIYSVGVTAKFPNSAGLPTNPDGTPACNLTGSDSFELLSCCSQLIGPLNASQKPGDPCTWLFSAQVANPDANTSFEWSFHDNTTAKTSLPQVEHTYPVGGITTGDTTVVMISGCPPQQLTVTITLNGCFPCPPGQHRDANGNCADDPCPQPWQHRDANGNCVDDPCPQPSQHRDASGNCVSDPPKNGFSWCCLLIWLWGILHLLGGSLLYFGLWIPGLIVAIIATIVLLIWVFVCCMPCARTFWKCCNLLKWLIMFNNTLVVILFALYAVGSSGVWEVVTAFGMVSAVLMAAMSASNCGSIPNILDPRTYPPCECGN